MADVEEAKCVKCKGLFFIIPEPGKLNPLRCASCTKADDDRLDWRGKIRTIGTETGRLKNG